MTSHPRWLLDLLRSKAPEARPADPDAEDPAATLLELARSLARQGHLHDAAREYANLSRKHGSPEIWLEQAELLLAMGDQFGAAANATRVLEVQPQNARALAVRRKVLAQDLQEEKR